MTTVITKSIQNFVSKIYMYTKDPLTKKKKLEFLVCVNFK